ncbi:MAG: diphthine synthase [Candidatus Parvarchaeota archaeon]|nr:diphthine synthase [Candidatus Parvarchaeota archaeon]MCL5420839.1 diphthine synthase [Candidatus Parvarchaeota archaeon]
MLYLIGTGLYYLNDLPLRAIDKLRECDEVFLENYTNLTDIKFKDELEKEVGKKISIVGREPVESEMIIRKAAEKNIALLVPGDPFAATTHFSLVQECKENNIYVKVIHASSIFSAVGETGFSLYKFGGTTSIPLYTEIFRPESFFDVIEKNIGCGYHTLVLLEVKDENKFVSPSEAEKILKEIEKKKGEKIIDWENVIAVSRLGSEMQEITATGKDDFQNLKPPCSLIIPGKLNENEIAAIKLIKHPVKID